MAKMVNTSGRVVHLPGGMMVPGQPVEVSDEDAARPVVKAMIEAGEIAPAPEGETESEGDKPHGRQSGGRNR